MICVCGYVYKELESDRRRFCEVGKRIGSKKFIEIHGEFKVFRDTTFGNIDNDGRFVSLYACPECNTVQLKD